MSTNKNKILVTYWSPIDIKRSTRNKPEERQKVIIEALSKHDEFTISEIIFDDLKSDDNNVNEFTQILMNVHCSTYLHFLNDAYSSFLNARELGLTRDHEYIDFVTNEDDSITELIGLVPNSNYNSFTDGETKQNIIHILPKWKLVNLFCTDTDCPIFSDTFVNVLYTAKSTFKAAQTLIATDDVRCVYVVTPSPGHHVGYRFYGGYCFLNNALIAGETLLNSDPTTKVCILDIDYHAGDGTHDIVKRYENYDDVKNRIMSISIHMNPIYDYPHARGFEFENTDIAKYITLLPNCNYDNYKRALAKAINMIIDFKCNYLVLAFGADTYYKDPEAVAKCELQLEDYYDIGETIGATCNSLNCKILITQEGGYFIEDIGLILKNLLYGINKNL